MSNHLSDDKINELIGKRFGKLVITGVRGRNKYNQIQYFARCDCGRVDFLALRNRLRANRINSCGCSKSNGRFDDLTGRKFTRLTVISRAENGKHGVIRWVCRCDCQTITIVRAGDLRSGNIKSCGCLKREIYVDSKDLTGHKFGRLTVVNRVGNDSNGCTQWSCECECKRRITVRRSALTNGRTRSCGCLNDEVRKNNHFKKHGIYSLNPKFYMHYRGMIERCFNTDRENYNLYGGRGITVSGRWLGDDGPVNFYNDMFSTWKEGLTLDRINVNESYSPENCRWATVEQQNSNRRDNVKFAWKGELKTLAEISRIYGVPYYRLYSRVVDLGWSIEEAINKPSQRYS